MLLEDFGGESLKILWSGRPFALPDFLHLAIQITDALGKVHQKNVITKISIHLILSWNLQRDN